MSLQGQTVRIIVHQPENWDKGNLFGTIISDRGGVSSPYLVHIKSKLFSFVLFLESMGRSEAKAQPKRNGAP